MSERELTLEWLPGRYAVCRLDALAPLPAWIGQPERPALLSITRTEKELSIVIEQNLLPREPDQAMPVQRDFVALRVAGTLDSALVGVLARLTEALAAAGVPVFVLSTYDTDVMLVREADAQRAVHALCPVARIAQREGSRPTS